MEKGPTEFEKVRDEAAEFGRRLGLLLATADMPDEQKEAWAALIPEMTARQMQELADALVLRIPDVEEQAFAELATKLEAATARRDERVAEATTDAEQALSDIESELDDPAT